MEEDRAAWLQERQVGEDKALRAQSVSRSHRGCPDYQRPTPILGNKNPLIISAPRVDDWKNCQARIND